MSFLSELPGTLRSWLGPSVSEALSFLWWHLVDPLFGQSSLHAMFLVSAALLGGVWLARHGGPGSAVARLFDRRVWLHPSALVDLRFFVLNQWLMAHVRLGAWVGSLVALVALQAQVAAGLDLLLGAAPAGRRPGWPATAAFTLAMGLAFDAARFLSHWLHHRVPVLWEFHKVHHSAQVLTVFTNYRNHPVEAMVELGLRLSAGALVSGVFAHWYDSGITELTVLNYGAITFVFYLSAHLRHSHVPLGFGPLERWFISPRMHQLHHSAEARHFDRNFGFMFSCWDRWAGTFYRPAPGETWSLGLPPEAGRFDSAWRLYLEPFGRAWALLRAGGQMPSAGSASKAP
jgi:sterol desaturase/sphingolipid hydroxylase (fatty acid hydroxylase superfamily)